MRKTKAFTLIELLIVVVIIGILATFVILALLNATKKAKDTRAKDAVKTVQDAADLVVNNDPTLLKTEFGTGSYPLNDTNYIKLKDDAGGQLLKSRPQDSTTGGFLTIHIPDSSGKYAICAQGINANHQWYATSTTNNFNTDPTSTAACPAAS